MAPFDTPSTSTSPTTTTTTTTTTTSSTTNTTNTTTVQENLVTRDGEVERELERMRMLLVRVADKVARVREREGTTGTEDGEDDLFGEGEPMVVDDVEVVERKKVQGLLDAMAWHDMT